MLVFKWEDEFRAALVPLARLDAVKQPIGTYNVMIPVFLEDSDLDNACRPKLDI